MPTVTTNDGTEIFYKDWGAGQPIMFHHGWPLSSDDWDAQLMFFVQRGFRVVAHDRRGHGRSSQVADGHDIVFNDGVLLPPRAREKLGALEVKPDVEGIGREGNGDRRRVDPRC